MKYVVYGEEGSYSSWTVWLVRVFDEEEAADSFAKELNDEVQRKVEEHRAALVAWSKQHEEGVGVLPSRVFSMEDDLKSKKWIAENPRPIFSVEMDPEQASSSASYSYEAVPSEVDPPGSVSL